MTEQTNDPLADVLAAHRPCPCGCGWCAANECHDLRGTGITWAAHVAAVVRASGAGLGGITREQIARAVWEADIGRSFTPPWETLPPHYQARWLARADAVLALRPDPAPVDTTYLPVVEPGHSGEEPVV